MIKFFTSFMAACLISATSFSQMLPNGDMELWNGGEPDNWISNIIVSGNFADQEDFSQITGNPGSALHIWNALGTRSSVSMDLDGYLPFTSSPTQFSMDYRMNLAVGEYVYGSVAIYDAGYSLISIANVYLTAANNSAGWQTTTVDFAGFGNVNPPALISANIALASGALLQNTTFLDIDNLNAIGSTTDVLDNLEQSGLRVYPIPASDQFTVESLEGPIELLQILDMSGRVCYEMKNENFTRQSMDLKSFEAGSYFLYVLTKESTDCRQIQIVH